MKRLQFVLDEGHRLARATQPAPRQQRVALKLRFHNLHPTSIIKDSIIHHFGPLRRRFVFSVKPEIRSREVGIPVVINIDHGHSIPPSNPFPKSGVRRGFRKPGVADRIGAQGPPFAGNYQFGAVPAVQIGPLRRIHHPAIERGRRKFPSCVEQQKAWARPRILAGHGAPSDKQIDIAIHVDIRSRHGAPARGLDRQGAGRCVRQSAAPVIEIDSILQRSVVRRGFTAPAHHIQIEIPIAFHVNPHCSHVFAGRVRCKSRHLAQRKLAAPSIDRQRTALPARPAQKDVVIAVTIDVAPCQPWPLMRLFVGQQWLALEIIEDPLPVLPTTQSTRPAKQRRCGRCGRWRRSQRRCTGFLRLRFRTRLRDVKKPIRRQIRERLPPPAGPLDRQFRNHRLLAQPKMNDRITRRQIPAGRRHIARQPLPVRQPHSDRGTQSPAIAGRSLQTHFGHMAGYRIVLIDASRHIRIAHHQIKISIVVEICRGRAKTDTFAVQPPSCSDVFEFQRPRIAEGGILFFSHRLLFPKFYELGGPGFEHVIGIICHVGMHRIAHDPVGYKQVQPSVIVEIFQPRRPCPIGARHPQELGGLQHAAGASIQIHGIPHELPGLSPV